MQTVEQYRVLELPFEGASEGNPYADVELSCRFERADGTDAVEARGFYRGEGRYAVRFMPRSAGEWTWRSSSSDPALSGREGSFEVTPAREGNHGRVLLSTDVRHTDAPFDPRGANTFSYEDGTRFMPFGTTCYAWVNQPEEVQEQTLRTLAASPFNKVRMCVFPKYYDYNHENPPMYAFEGSVEEGFDHSRFYEPFWENLDRRLAQLDELGIQADLIVLHPYDREEWGFSKMTREEDAFYLSYVARRYSAYKNVWWSLANEWDLMPWKSVEDWDQYARVIMANDPYGHLRSIHNCRTLFDHSHPWITHVSWQRCDLQRTTECVTELRAAYGKPVVADEVAYEGNINWGWGNITAQEMTRRFWEGCLRGGYVTHGETYVDRGPTVWWAHGGELYGESPARIAFCREFMESLPQDMDLVPYERGLCLGTMNWDITCMANGWGDGQGDVVMYFGFFRPSYRDLVLPEGRRYAIDVVDTWNMTTETLPGTYAGEVRVDLPSRQYMLLHVRAVEGE